MTAKLTAERVKLLDSLDMVYEWFYEQGLTDGLPIIPPTEARVQAMLRHVAEGPQTVIGKVPPRWATATVEDIAINAVMAGCLPTHLSVVIAAVEAMLEPKFNLYALQATTGSPAVMLIINGPVANELDVNCGHNCLGQGWRANATIGRAIRLIQINIGGAIPGVTDKSTVGWPGKYTFCMAENEERSPWEPLHVERGFQARDSTVTVASACGLLRIGDLDSTTAEGVLTTIASAMAIEGGAQPILVLCPEHAEIIARDNLSKQDVKRFLYEKTAHPLSQMSPDVITQKLKRRPDLHPGVDSLLRVAYRPEDIIVVVGGGAGAHSLFIPGWGQSTPTGGSTQSVTKLIAHKTR